MPSDSPVSLREYVDVRLEASDELNRTRWTAHRHEHELIAEALRQAQANESTWRANANEWRSTISDLMSRFVTSQTAEAMNKRVDTLESWRDTDAGRILEQQRQLERRVWMAGLTLGCVTILVNVALYLVWGRH